MQHDYVISNDTGANVRADINNVLQAILTNNSGATQPSATQAGMFWGDTSNASTYYLKIRNHTNDGWVSLYAYDVATKTISPANTPAGNISSTTMQGAINELDTEKQATLVSGTNIKSINSSSILASGNLDLVAKVSSTDNAIVRFDGTSGAVQNSSVVIDDSGNVGIGTSSPTAKLEISSSNSGLTSTTANNTIKLTDTDLASALNQPNGKIEFENNDGTLGSAIVAYVLSSSAGSDGGGDLRFGTTINNSTTASERMRIDSSGNVGIGTSSITGVLDIKSIAYSQFSIKSDRTTGNIGGVVFYDGTPTARGVFNCTAAGVLSFRANSGSSSGQHLTIDSSGNVGIGTSSPSYKLHLSSDSAAKPSTNTWTISSDERLKENIELADLDRCYEIVKTIPLKRYTWKDSVYTQEQVSDRSKLGWIANDVQTVFPKAVNTHSQQLATFKIELKDVEEQKLISEAIPAQEEIKDEDGNIIQEFIEAKEAVYETITVQKEEKVYDVLDDCLDLNSDQIYAVMYGAIQKLQLTVEALTARVEALEAK